MNTFRSNIDMLFDVVGKMMETHDPEVWTGMDLLICSLFHKGSLSVIQMVQSIRSYGEAQGMSDDEIRAKLTTDGQRVYDSVFIHMAQEKCDGLCGACPKGYGVADLKTNDTGSEGTE